MSENEKNALRDKSTLKPEVSRLRLWVYLVPIMSVPILIFVAAILVIPSDWFAERSGDTFLPALGYGADLRNMNCAVAVYGDSSALIGVNPGVIEKRTGLKTCNIAEVQGVTVVNGTMVVDDFLKHNPPPQYLVFLYAPENYAPQTRRGDPEVPAFEGITYRFKRHGNLSSLIVLMKHPDELFSWVIHGTRMAITGIFTKPFPSEVKQRRSRSQGQGFLNFSAIKQCSYRSLARQPDVEFMRGLRSRYSNSSTTVLVDSMELPECDPDIAYFRHSLSGLIDNEIGTLPVGDYYGGGRHANPNGSVPLSNMIADQILGRIDRERTIGAR